MTHHDDTQIPETLRAIHRELDTLGAHERAGADDAFEDRILAAVRDACTGADRAHRHAPRRVRAFRFLLPRLALAAAVVLVVGLGVTLWPGAGATTPPPLVAQAPEEIRVALESNLDALEALSGVGEGIEAQLADVSLRADAVDAQIMMPGLGESPLDTLGEDAL